MFICFFKSIKHFSKKIEKINSKNEVITKDKAGQRSFFLDKTIKILNKQERFFCSFV